MNSLLSRITLLGVDRIYPYEWSEKSASSDYAIERNGIIRHPYPVYHIDQDRYLLLEGTDPFARISAEGIQYIPVQLCRNSDLRFAARSLGLVNIYRKDIEELALTFPRCMLLADNGNRPPESYLELSFSFRSETPARLFVRRTNGAGCPEPMQDVFRAIKSKGDYLPTVRIDGRPESLCKSVDLTGTVRLPSFGLNDAVGAVTSGCLFPPGVVSSLLASRILNIDFPVSVLCSDRPITEKEAFLRDLITVRDLSRKTSFFKGRVYLLNR